MRKLSAIRKATGGVREIHLTPLGSDDLAHLLTDAFIAILNAARRWGS